MSGGTQLIHKDNTPKNNPLRARMMVALVASEEARHHSSTSSSLGSSSSLSSSSSVSELLSGIKPGFMYSLEASSDNDCY